MSDVITAEADLRTNSDRRDGATSQADQAWTQYVTFTVDGRSYGIEITVVREIRGWNEPTELPSSPHAMRGVVNLRGVIVPIFDLRARFGLGETHAQSDHVVIIVTLGNSLIGVLVDAVSDILTLDPGTVLPVPAVNDRMDQDFISGLVSHDDRLVALLRLDELFQIEGIPC